MKSMKFFTLLLYGISLWGIQIELGEQILKVEVADTQKAILRGLMGRTSLPEGTGMLFVFQEQKYLNFWMKDTLIPLSIAFFDADQVLLNILDLDPPTGSQIPSGWSSGPAQYVLEVAQGWFAKKEIESGMKFSFLDPSDQLKYGK